MPISVSSVFTADNAQSSGAVTSPAFTPAVGDVLVALVVSEDSSVTISSVSGGSLTWTKRVESVAGSNAYASIWTATATSATSMTVATSAFGSAGARLLTVLDCAGAQLATTPATVSTRGSGAPSTTITTTAAGSIVAWLNGDWNAISGARTYRTTSGTPTEAGYGFRSGGAALEGVWQPAASAGSQTLGMTAPAGQKWNLLGIEVQASGGGGASLTATPADNLGVTDSASEVQSYVRSATEAVAVTDDVTAQRTGTQTQSPTEPVGVTDALTVGWNRAATINDGVGVTDPGQALDMGANLNDPVGVTDSASEVQAYAATLGDAVGVTDSATASRSGAGAANPSDAAGITDAVVQASDYARAAADPVGVSDALTVAWSRVATVDDFLALTDAASSGTTSDGAANVNDPAGVTDTVGWTSGRDRPLTDPVGVTDGVVAVLDRVATEAPADTVGVTDTVTVQRIDDPSGFIDVRVLAVVDRSRVVTITDRSRTVAITEHPRTVTITDRS